MMYLLWKNIRLIGLVCINHASNNQLVTPNISFASLLINLFSFKREFNEIFGGWEWVETLKYDRNS